MQFYPYFVYLTCLRIGDIPSWTLYHFPFTWILFSNLEWSQELIYIICSSTHLCTMLEKYYSEQWIIIWGSLSLCFSAIICIKNYFIVVSIQFWIREKLLKFSLKSLYSTTWLLLVSLLFDYKSSLQDISYLIGICFIVNPKLMFYMLGVNNSVPTLLNCSCVCCFPTAQIKL